MDVKYADGFGPQTGSTHMQTAAAQIPASLARLLADADAITAARTLGAQRRFLASKESVYADSTDHALVTAAFAGWAVGTMDDLARELRQEIARHA